MDARDYFRGLRPWDQFYNYVKTLALTEGSQFWAAQLNDPRFDEERKKQLAERKQNGETSYPSLPGYTRLVSALDELTDHVWMLRAEAGKWGKPRPRPKPIYPEDRYHEEQVAMSRSKVNAVLAVAHAIARGEGVN